MGVSQRLSRLFSKSEVDKMDTAAKKAAGSPGYDDETIAAQKEYAKEKKIDESKKLTKKEEAAADREAYNSAMGNPKTEKKAKPLTDKEKQELQDSLNFAKGGAVKKKPAAKKMACGGSVKKMAVGGMVKCGASNPPAQKGKK